LKKAPKRALSCTTEINQSSNKGQLSVFAKLIELIFMIFNQLHYYRLTNYQSPSMPMSQFFRFPTYEEIF